MRKLTNLIERMHQILCRILTSHDDILVTVDNRRRALCTRCGRISVGWHDEDTLARRHGPFLRRDAKPQRSNGYILLEDGGRIPVVVHGLTVHPEQPEIVFEQDTMRELRRGRHQKPVEWRGNTKLH